MYNIINKIELINGVVVYTPIGYSTNTLDIQSINSTYESSFGDWIRNNKNDLESGNIQVSDYFNNNPICYTAYQQTTSIEGMNLSEITDIQNMN
jgi:hypothetical protein